MSTGPIYLASDIHLGAIPAAHAADFLAWLEEAASVTSHIVINGDLFDFWFEYRRAIPRGHTRALGLLAEIVDAGVRIDLTGGNHDWWGGSYLEEEIGVHFHRDPLRVKLAGRRALVAHGDGLGPGDLGYRALKTILRSPLFVSAFRRLHPDLGAWIADRASLTRLRTGPPTDEDIARSELLRRWAFERLQRDPSLDLLLLGHTHLPLLERTPGGGWYLNTGDWVHHRSYAVLREGRDPVLRLRGGGEIPPLEPDGTPE